MIKKYNEFLNEDLNNIHSNITYKYDYEWVDINTMWQLREFDRSIESESRADSSKVIEDLTSKLRNGFTSPLILQYSHKYKTAYLIEGNHRLYVAKQLGYKYVPVRVTTDGVEKQNAHKVIGYYAPMNEKFDVYVPSEIGIPNCYDENFKKVVSNNSKYLEGIDFSILPDVEVKGKNIIFKPNPTWKCMLMFSDEDERLMSDALNNKNPYENKDLTGSGILDELFSDEMKKMIKLPYKERKYPNDYRTIYDEYYYEYFIDSEEYKLYVKELSRCLWEKVRKNILDKIQGDFYTRFDGFVSFYNSRLVEDIDFDKKFNKIPNGKYWFEYEGLEFAEENFKDYYYDGEEETFEEILRNNYQKPISMEFKSYEDYIIDVNELKVENIFK